MKVKFKGISLSLLLGALVLGSLPAAASECVVLLHGLARTERSMGSMEQFLHAQGYVTVNVDYPSREFPIETLAHDYLAPAVEKGCAGTEKVNFVSHSMGGIVTREYLRTTTRQDIGRIVMLAPPNRGSEMVDWFHGIANATTLTRKLFGPAFFQLSAHADAYVNTDPSLARGELGVIAGARTMNIFASAFILPGPDDGKVTLERTRLPGMKDYLVVAHSHMFMMKMHDVQQATLHFLQTGHFNPAANQG